MDPEPLPSPAIRRLRLDDLRPASEIPAARPFSRRRAAALAEHFDASRFGRPVVSCVDGVPTLVDGRHRVEAYRQQPGVIGETLVDCDVYDNVSSEHLSGLVFSAGPSGPASAGGSDNTVPAGD